MNKNYRKGLLLSQSLCEMYLLPISLICLELHSHIVILKILSLLLLRPSKIRKRQKMTEYDKSRYDESYDSPYLFEVHSDD